MTHDSLNPSSGYAWAAAIGRSLRSLRTAETTWQLRLIDGPNMSNLGPGGRDQRTYGVVSSLEELHQTIRGLAEGLGTRFDSYTSNFEGDVVRYIYETAADTDAYLINPAGMNKPGVPGAQALADGGRPYMELHFANVAASGMGNGTVVSKWGTGLAMGLRQYGYIAALHGLVSALDSGELIP